jgi:hypothetical protein
LARLSRQERIEIARMRIPRIVGKHQLATMRTLEMKISDAGPFDQRIDPHILTEARNELVAEGILMSHRVGPSRPPWFYLGNTVFATLADRFNLLHGIQTEYSENDFLQRTGQALEIAVYRALQTAGHVYFGGFPTLGQHDDGQLYKKQEPPNHIGANAIPGDRLVDFLVQHGGLWAAIECKNIREWIYSDRPEIKQLIDKALHLDAVPVLIARRIHPSTFLLFNKCGLIIHQVYNQRLANHDADLASRAADKNLLGYFDIRVGNAADARLTKFIAVNLPLVLPAARTKFDDYKDLLTAYCQEGMSYEEFAARVRRRFDGTNEDGDWEV